MSKRIYTTADDTFIERIERYMKTEGHRDRSEAIHTLVRNSLKLWEQHPSNRQAS